MPIIVKVQPPCPASDCFDDHYLTGGTIAIFVIHSKLNRCVGKANRVIILVARADLVSGIATANGEGDGEGETSDGLAEGRQPVARGICMRIKIKAIERDTGVIPSAIKNDVGRNLWPKAVSRTRGRIENAIRFRAFYDNVAGLRSLPAAGVFF